MTRLKFIGVKFMIKKNRLIVILCCVSLGILGGCGEDSEEKAVSQALEQKNNAEENAQNLKYFNTADTLEKQGEFEAAIESLDQITKHFEDYSLVKKRKKELENEILFRDAHESLENMEYEKAIELYNDISKSYSRYDEVKQALKIVKASYEVSQSKTVGYLELKKDSKKFKGEMLFFEGTIANIQQKGNKTFMVIATKYARDGYYIGDDILVYYDGVIDSLENDYINIHGIMQGNYDSAFKKVTKFLGESIMFEYSGDTFINQAPVIEAKHINYFN